MLGISKLGKSHGAQVLFSEASINFNAGSRYGIVGAEYSPDDGSLWLFR